MGPEGPLVRFDQSPPSSFSVPSGGGTPAIAAGDWRLRSRNRSHPRVQGVEAVPRVGVTVSGADGVIGGELRGGRRASGAEWFWGYGGPQSKSSSGNGLREDEGALGGENGEWEALVVPNWPGQWWRLQLPEVGKKTSPGSIGCHGRTRVAF